MRSCKLCLQKVPIMTDSYQDNIASHALSLYLAKAATNGWAPHYDACPFKSREFVKDQRPKEKENRNSIQTFLCRPKGFLTKGFQHFFCNFWGGFPSLNSWQVNMILQF
jgi:hypothetical protein